MTAAGRSEVGTIRIQLGADHVGDLKVYPDERTEFAFTRDYLAMHPRPVLGQRFEDDLHAVHRSRMQLPPFFSNLLWEERIRELVAAQIDVSPRREASLLAYLGEDLPGAVRAVSEGALPAASGEHSLLSDEAQAHPIKLSLAGMQPKLSMLRTGRGLTFPATGLGGDWLVKFPGGKYAGVPENEFVTMTWARESGVTVPEFELVPVARLENVPPELLEQSGNAFAIRRFDRPRPGERIHVEDFAQVLGVYPTHKGKYLTANYETLGKIIRGLHPPSFDEFLRRLVFVVLSANGDAHVKNWALWYPDRVSPELSPAYDLVSTIEFIPRDALGLNLAGDKAWSSVRLASFESLAVKIGADPGEVARVVRDAVTRTLDAWGGVKGQATAELVSRLEEHWERVPLVAEITGAQASVR